MLQVDEKLVIGLSILIAFLYHSRPEWQPHRKSDRRRVYLDAGELRKHGSLIAARRLSKRVAR